MVWLRTTPGRRTAALVVLYGVLVGLLWYNLFWEPHHIPFVHNALLPRILVAFCTLGVAIVLVLLPGHAAIKLLLIFLSGMYVSDFGDIALYMANTVPVFLDGRLFILAICAISVGISLLQRLFALGLRSSLVRHPRWVKSLDTRQQSVLRAGFDTVVWIVVLAFWLARHDGEPNLLGWLPGNLGFVLFFFAYQCLVTGGISEAPVLRDWPAITLLSQEEVDRVQAHIVEEQPVGTVSARS